MRNLFLLLIGLLIFIGCNKSSVNKDYQWWDGYLADTVGLNIMYYEFTDNDLRVAGIKSGRLWVSMFNQVDKECVFTFVDDEVFKSQRIFNKGYGEFETIDLKMNGLIVDNISSYKRLYVGYETGKVDMFIINQQDDCIYKVLAGNNILFADLYPWFEDYLIIRSYENNFVDVYCISSKGEKIFNMDINCLNLISEIEPISIKEGVHIERGHNEHYNGSYRINIETGQKIWETNIYYDDIQDNAKVAIERTRKEGNDWYYVLNITNYDGSKETRNFKISIENGEYVILDK